MSIGAEIAEIIEEAKRVCVPVEKTSNLYTELGFDSLAFVALLLKIEERYSISFELMEMETCLQVDRLTALVERKVKEAACD